MLRRRPPQTGSSFVGDDDDPAHKRHFSGKKAKNDSLRVLSATLSSAILSALNPSPDVRGQAYSEYLTSQVQNLTIGWHIFRTITEGAFLATHGLAFNTSVVQLFWSMSVGSVLLYCVARPAWLAWRERICVATNIVYGLVTVLKILNLLDRLPNENHYMFKHCFLTMADAAFSQTPVHQQYVVQFAEAVIRVVVWRRYNVLADTPTWGVIAVSLAWQLWLVTFSSMLQARHVSAFRRRQRPNDVASVSNNPPSARSSLSAVPAAAASSRPDSCEIEPATCASTSKTAAVPLAVAAVAAPPPISPSGEAAPRVSTTTLRASKSPRSSLGARGGGEGTAVSTPSAVDALRISSVSSTASASQKRLLRALRSVARGPSSYVLLSHQRRQVGGPQSATAQFYIPTANPDMLSGNWRERLATAVAEGAPGWQVTGVCVRKGSLIVHLDLVYAPNPTPTPATMPTTAGGNTAATGGGAAAAGAIGAVAAVPAGDVGPLAVDCNCGAGAGAGEVCYPGVSYSEQPFDVVAGRSDGPRVVLKDYLGGMGAESLLELLGLPPDLPSGPLHPIRLQLGDAIKDLTAPELSVDDAPDPASDLARSAPAEAPAPACVDAAAAATTTTTSDIKAEVPAPVAAAAAAAEAWRRLVSLPLATALHPPGDLRTRDYSSFLSARVGPLHVAYASFICLASTLFFMVRGGPAAVNPLTMLLFTSAELLTLASRGLLGGCGSPAWRGVRCGVVYAGVCLRALQMAACTCGFLPHLLRDSDCVSGRWIQKVVLITTLQALCMQPPVRTFFLVRIPSVLLSVYVHVYVCRTSTALGTAVALHVGWEALLFLISANFQYRHLEAFRRRGGVLQRNPSRSCCQELEEQQQLLQPSIASKADCAAAPAERAAAAAAPARDEKPAAALATRALSPPPTSSGFAPVAAAGDPTDVALSAPLVAMAPRRAARLQLHFNCAPAVVEELQVVLRHINPAAMSSGVHSAHAVRDITRALVTPAGAAAAPPLSPAPFVAELTLVASPADRPGLVHVELWRGRRRVATQPVLLAAAPPQTAAAGGGQAAAPGGDSWLDDVTAYVAVLREQGHGAAADQFIEELGSWMAQAAALERGLTAADAGGGGGAAGGGGGAPRVANVLYFHGYGSKFMYLKPRRVSGAGGGSAAAGAAVDPLHDTLRQLLLVQGSMLLAVAVEAGCVALSEHLVAAMVGEETGMGGSLAGLMESARTPVTQLPLLHAAVKSGESRMVDLVAQWSVSCGLKDIWAAEAAILAVALDQSCASSTAGDNITAASALSSVAAEPAEAGAAGSSVGWLAMATRRRSPLSMQLAPDRASGSALSALEARSSHDEYNHHINHHNHHGSSASLQPQPQSNESQSLSQPPAAAQVEFQAAPFVTSGEGGVDRVVAAAPPSDVLNIDALLNSEAGDGDGEAGLRLSEESPFRIINFRASNRNAGALMAEADAAGDRRNSSRYVGDGTGAPVSAAAAAALVDGAGGCSSVLVDSGVLVLTPLHMSLALADEGRLASHILRNYPEAYELWRSNNLNLGLDSAVSTGGVGTGGGSGGLPANGGSTMAHLLLEGTAGGPGNCSSSSGPNFVETVLVHEASGAGAGGRCGVMGSSSSNAAVAAAAASTVAAFSSLPGLVGRAKAAGGGGMRGMGSLPREDSVEAGSIQSMSLSEVAFFEGIRWVDEDAGSRRPGFKVTRM